MLSDDHIKALTAFVDKNGARISAADIDPFTHDWRGTFKGKSPLVLLPKTTSEVAAIVDYCNQNKIALVPQGGNTGLVRGGVPDETGDQIVLNLARLNNISKVDKANRSVTVGAGAILQNIQEAAAKDGLLYPISLGSEGSCQIGGNISTNAGGIHVLKYGMTREQVLGLEVVLPDGTIHSNLKALRKDNTGFDLDQLFIGAEGTLGIITAAVLKLHPAPNDQQTILFGLSSLDNMLDLFETCQSHFGNALAAFEIFADDGFQHVLSHIEGVRQPFEGRHAWYALVDLWSHAASNNAAELDRLFENLMKTNTVHDALIAPNLLASKQFWHIRDTFAEALKKQGSRYAFDISVAVSDIPKFVRSAKRDIDTILPGIEGIAFGHAGDGNIHFNLCPTEKITAETISAHYPKIADSIHTLVSRLGGSISAEHGIGRHKANILEKYKPKSELAAMRRIKTTLDPNNIMNPGCIFPN